MDANEQLAAAVERCRVQPGEAAGLDRRDPADRSGFEGSQQDAEPVSDELRERMRDLQEQLWAQREHRLLVVLQAMDTGGKDGAIRRISEGMNAAGLRVATFKAPTPPELAHDYLWRIHPPVPGDGEVVVFNRSHYEDVLVVKVHGWAPPERIERRYGHITAFEQLLADEGTTIVKLHLHISKAEQKERLQARLDDPTKLWKFNPGDLEERELWDDYQAAYETALTRTSTAAAPWYVIPANRKWYRDLLVQTLLVRTLEDLDLRWPDPPEGLDPAKVVIPD